MWPSPDSFPLTMRLPESGFYTALYPCFISAILFCLCSEEEGVGFEDHVLLNHLLKGFPSRGTVHDINFKPYYPAIPFGFYIDTMYVVNVLVSLCSRSSTSLHGDGGDRSLQESSLYCPGEEGACPVVQRLLCPVL